MTEKLRIIVGGYIGLYPTGGAAWDYVQYPVGLKMLGHDVYYIEDTLQYPVFQSDGISWNDATGCITFLRNTMQRFGLQDRWAYRDVASEKSYGMAEQKILEICSSADVFLNISCSTYLRDEYRQIPRRVLIDSDPMFTQIQYACERSSDSDTASRGTIDLIEGHNYLFTFGENVGQPDCRIPTFDFQWRTTRQPICVDLWSAPANPGTAFTSIMNWSGRSKLLHEGTEWGQKDVEFEKIKQIPALVPDIGFDIVVNKPLNKESHFDFAELRKLGWKVQQPEGTVTDPETYRAFILSSAAEFSVAKETYIKSRSGWFSGRSGCYLAAGRPVVTQETGWSKYIPSGSGLLPFTDLDSAVDAVQMIHSDYDSHSRAARCLARKYFDSDAVLTQLLEQLN